MGTIDGDEWDAVTIDGEDVSEITVDGETVWEAIDLVDGYEHASLSTYYTEDNASWDLSDFTTTTSWSHGGSRGFRLTSTSGRVGSYPSGNAWNDNTELENYPQAGDTIAYYVRVGMNTSGFNSDDHRVRLRFVANGPSSTFDHHIEFDNDPPTQYFFDRLGGGGLQDSSGIGSHSQGDVLRVEIDTSTSGSVSARVYDGDSDTQLGGTISGSIPSYPSDFGFGWHIWDQSSTKMVIDDHHIA